MQDYKDIIDFINSINSEICNINSVNKLKEIKKNIDIDILKEHSISNVSRQKLLLKKLLLKLVNKKEISLRKTETNTKINLNKILKRNICHPESLDNLIKKNNIINRNIGAIPEAFFKNIEHNERREKADELFNILAKYSLDLLLRDTDDDDYLHWLFEERNRNINNLANQLSKILNTKVIVEYIGRGHNGNVFKLILNGKNFIYKCFFPFKYKQNYLHGKNAEPQYALYATLNEKNKFAEFYFGRVCSESDYDGFIVAEYLDNNNNSICNKQKYLKDKLQYLSIDYRETRKASNMIGDKIIDFGAIIEICPELKSKAVRYYINLIIENIKFHYIKQKIQYYCNVDAKGIQCIKNGITKFNNKTDYLKALDTIKKYIDVFPTTLYNDLKQIFLLDKHYKYSYTKKLDIKSLFDSNIQNTLNQLNYYNLHHQFMDTKPDINMNGYVQVELYDNYSAVITFNKEKVLNVRFEKVLNNEYIVIYKANNAEDLSDFDFEKLEQL